MSSISPIATKGFAARIEEMGCDYLGAPVSGGEVGAKAASLTILVGGRSDVFERAKPLFEKMGKNITLIGDGDLVRLPRFQTRSWLPSTFRPFQKSFAFPAKQVRIPPPSARR